MIAKICVFLSFFFRHDTVGYRRQKTIFFYAKVAIVLIICS